MIQPHFAIGCDDASAADLVVVTMLDPRIVDLNVRRPNGDPLWVVRSEVWGLGEARREVSGIRPNAMTVDVLPAVLADRFVADVLRTMEARHHPRYGMAWDFVRDVPAVGMIVHDWREADFSARITLSAAQRWMEERFDIVATTDRNLVPFFLHDGLVDVVGYTLAAGPGVWIPTEREALNGLRSMLVLADATQAREDWVWVRRCGVSTDEMNGRWRASCRLFAVHRKHLAALVAHRHRGEAVVRLVREASAS